MTGIAEGSTKALICFSSFSLWLCFKLPHTHIHGPLHIYFALTSFVVNLGCLRGLNMAVITGYYESQVSGALLPNVNDCRHRNFHDYHKKPIPGGGKRYECVYMCTAAHIPACVCSINCVLYSLYVNAIYCRGFINAHLLELHDILTAQVYYCMNADCIYIYVYYIYTYVAL